MASEIQLPALGENVESGEVVDVKVAVGDAVQAGQTLIEVESEKATVEVPAPEAGRITEVKVKKGDRVATGQTLFLIDIAGAADPSTNAPQKKSAPPEKQSAAKAAPSAPPAAAPELRQPKPPADNDKAQQRDQPTPSTSEGQLVPAGPATRRLARELGVDLAAVAGSAKHGRVTQEDVKAYVRDLTAGKSAPTFAASAPALPDFAQWGPVEKKPLDSIRRKIAEQLSRAWTLIPHVTHQDLADITELESFRKQHDSAGPKITVTAFALKAAAIMLRQFPAFNASLDAAAGQVIYKQYYHIGVAVDTEQGLLVPVIRDVDKKSVHDLAKELAEVAEQARNKKLPPDAMRGGVFTITNLGGIGGIAFSPIINYPQVAILGMSRARMQPVYKDGEFVPRLLLPLSLSYDHRLIDGADAARFTRRFAELLENPLVMLLHA